MSKFMQTLNGCLMCSIDTETTGTDPLIHDIIQIAVLPLDSYLKPSTEFRPFITDIAPMRPENASDEAMRVNKTKMIQAIQRGMDAGVAADRFVEWFEDLNLGYNKRIIPLGHNWPFDKSFITQWLGPLTYDLIFDARVRDTQVAAAFLNDLDGWRGRDHTYQKISLSYLCTQLKITREDAHSAVDDARVTAEIYRRMLQQFIGG